MSIVRSIQRDLDVVIPSVVFILLVALELFGASLHQVAVHFIGVGYYFLFAFLIIVVALLLREKRELRGRYDELLERERELYERNKKLLEDVHALEEQHLRDYATISELEIRMQEVRLENKELRFLHEVGPSEGQPLH